ncbi:hypothetical protein N9W17_04265 [Jannaschia sp.]|nr:hypothetical protein [Jannaschia sp.]
MVAPLIALTPTGSGDDITLAPLLTVAVGVLQLAQGWGVWAGQALSI